MSRDPGWGLHKCGLSVGLFYPERKALLLVGQELKVGTQSHAHTPHMAQGNQLPSLWICPVWGFVRVFFLLKELHCLFFSC